MELAEFHNCTINTPTHKMLVGTLNQERLLALVLVGLLQFREILLTPLINTCFIKIKPDTDPASSSQQPGWTRRNEQWKLVAEERGQGRAAAVLVWSPPHTLQTSRTFHNHTEGTSGYKTLFFLTFPCPTLQWGRMCQLIYSISFMKTDSRCHLEEF